MTKIKLASLLYFIEFILRQSFSTFQEELTELTPQSGCLNHVDQVGLVFVSFAIIFTWRKHRLEVYIPARLTKSHFVEADGPKLAGIAWPEIYGRVIRFYTPGKRMARLYVEYC